MTIIVSASFICNLSNLIAYIYVTSLLEPFLDICNISYAVLIGNNNENELADRPIPRPPGRPWEATNLAQGWKSNVDIVKQEVETEKCKEKRQDPMYLLSRKPKMHKQHVCIL